MLARSLMSAAHVLESASLLARDVGHVSRRRFGLGVPQQDFAADRRRMVEEIDAELASSPNGGGLARLGPRVRAAMDEVPRHEFVPPEHRSAAYENEPLPIGDVQTISQPLVVALMTELLQPKKTDRVLEVGTGSGYQCPQAPGCRHRKADSKIDEEIKCSVQPFTSCSNNYPLMVFRIF